MELTWHFVEESLSSTRVGLQVFAVFRPVKMCDKTRATLTFPNLLVPLSHGINIDEVVVGAHCQVLPIRRILHLMEHFFAVFDASYF